MPLTRDFKETVMARAQHGPAFRSAILIEATDAFLGDIDPGKALLRDYLNATAALSIIAGELNEKSLRRMLGPAGNPTLKNFINLLTACCRIEHLQLHVCQH